jgi:hypothetical protein
MVLDNVFYGLTLCCRTCYIQCINGINYNPGSCGARAALLSPSRAFSIFNPSCLRASREAGGVSDEYPSSVK